MRALVRPRSNRADLAGLPIELVEGDIHRPATLERAFAGCQAFVHAAGFYPTDSISVARAVNAGLASVEPVFEAARAARVERGVYVSSLSTIPPAGAPGSGEVWEGTGPYSAAKAAMERAALDGAAAGLPLVIVNPTLCLGEYDRKPTSGRIMLEIARGRVPVYLDGPTNVVYTGDVGLGIARALEHGKVGKRYVLGGENTTFEWLLRQIAFELGARPPLFRIPLPAARVGARLVDRVDGLRKRPAMAAMAVELAAGSQHFDLDTAARELGLAEPTPAVETIRRAVRWFRTADMLRRPGAEKAR